MYHDPTVTQPPFPIGPVSQTVPAQRATPGEVAAWLDLCEAELLHPGQIEDRLRRAGWHPEAVRAAVRSYRTRFNQHTLGYTALLASTGLAALGAGTAGHLLAAGIYQPVNRDALGVWLTLMVCTLPFAIWAHVWAARTDGRDPVATYQMLRPMHLWSAGAATRCCGRCTEGDSPMWAYGFLHRFDPEDPTTPALRTRPAADEHPGGRPAHTWWDVGGDPGHR